MMCSNNNSRYEMDFIDKRLIRSDRFGHVYSAIHKLICVKYAVKCIIMKNTPTHIEKCVNEVKILSQYNHPNIVGFQSAWIENYYPVNEKPGKAGNKGKNGALGSGSVVKSKVLKKKLYIQMEFCNKTLEEWMKQRTEPTPSEIVGEIFIQIVKALHCIHSSGAVHHDIKPANIFIDTTRDLQIKIGNFGLACAVRQKRHPHKGTLGYTAPEQFRNQCDPKSDIYSLGIILFELLFHMPTAMERSLYIEQLQLGEFAAIHYKKYPVWCDLIKKLIQHDSTKRPSAKELLQLYYDNDKNNIINHYKKPNLGITNTLERLTSNHDTIIENLEGLKLL